MQLRSALIFGATFVLCLGIAILLGKAPAEKLDMGLTVHQLCAKYGFNLHDETVKSEDGYLLTMHRLRCPRNKPHNCTTKGPPVLLMHGLFGSSADFLAPKNQSLAFQLADKGYDVWLGNNRGNTYSRKHIMLDPDDNQFFWDFSYHEIAEYDLPAMIDHILSKSSNPRLTFVGMSQGSTAYLAMMALKPKYNKKIAIANLMSPITTFYPTKNMLLRLWSIFNFIIEWTLYYIGPREIMGDSGIETWFLRYACLGPHKIANYICIDQILKYGMGFSDEKDYDLFPFHISVSPAGASIKELQHMVQNKISGKFAQYDYYARNQEIYNQNTPPIYNVSKITSPVAVYYGKADVYVSVEGLYNQLRTIPNVVLSYKVPYNDFNHMDFIYAKDLNNLVNDKVLETIDTYNKKSKIK